MLDAVHGKIREALQKKKYSKFHMAVHDKFIRSNHKNKKIEVAYSWALSA
jgi:hypothetical protein